MLLQWAENYVAESGRSLLSLDCGAQNHKLRNLYESVGYHWVKAAMLEAGLRTGARALREGFARRFPWLIPNVAKAEGNASSARSR